MTEHPNSQLYRLIEDRIDGTLAEYVAARWPRKGWRKIAADIHTDTGITVSHATLITWFEGRITVETRVA